MNFFTNLDKAARQHNIVRQNASPKQRTYLESTDSIFEKAIKAEFEDRLIAEDALRAHFKGMLGVSVKISEIEKFSSILIRQPAQTAFVFSFRDKSYIFFKNSSGGFDLVNKYVAVLEKTIIDVTNNSLFSPLGFFGLIKLAFYNLSKGIFAKLGVLSHGKK